MTEMYRRLVVHDDAASFLSSAQMVIRPAAPEANSSTGAAAAAMPAFEATVTLRSRDLSASAEAKGKVCSGFVVPRAAAWPCGLVAHA